MVAEPTARSPSFAVHATAVAIGGRALLIRGASRAGKSRLALALIGRTTQALPIRLIGDDRILLHRVADTTMARPHPRISGFIERRGLGLVTMPWVAQAPVAGIVHLGPAELPARPSVEGGAMLAGLAVLALRGVEEPDRARHVLVWWAGLSAAWAPHLPEKADDPLFACAKD